MPTILHNNYFGFARTCFLLALPQFVQVRAKLTHFAIEEGARQEAVFGHQQTGLALLTTLPALDNIFLHSISGVTT
jgi:hypothetical protein